MALPKGMRKYLNQHGHLGFIPEPLRTPQQQAAHAAAVGAMPKFKLDWKDTGAATKVMLTDAWKNPKVVADVGFVFPRFHQLSGSCFVQGTKVRMTDGSEKPIESMAIGDEVFSHLGKKRKVVRIFRRLYSGVLHTFRVKGWRFPVTMTHDHDCLVVQGLETPEKRFRFNGFFKKKAETVERGEKFLLPEVSFDGSREFVEHVPYGFAGTIQAIDGEHVVDHPVYCCEVEEEHSLIVNGIAQHQCVGAGGGQAIFTLSAVQRLLAANPTKAFLPFWPFNYGLSRLYMGERSPGEGSLGSTFAKAVKDGILDAQANADLPKFKEEDGLVLTKQLEMEWSDGDSPTVQKWMDKAKPHPIGTVAELRDFEDVWAAVNNGYPGTVACDRYIGKASVQGDGADACCIGKWDNSGGHQQSFHSAWTHPKFGRLVWIHNNWPKSTYPDDPAGGPVGGCWVKEADFKAVWNMHGEVYAFSALNYFPAVPDVPSILDWSTL